VITTGKAALADLVNACVGMFGTGVRVGETMIASNSVIGARMAIMRNAVCNPAAGDYEELGGMLGEKMVAASKVGQALFDNWFETLADASALQYCSLALGGASLSARERSALGNRWMAHGTRMMSRTIDVGGLALAPVHQQATANARRLR
jgi:hypothetical protein